MLLGENLCLFDLINQMILLIRGPNRPFLKLTVTTLISSLIP
jgi:hypothetical protein